MKRIALKLVVFLLLGAILNVAVAWGCILKLPYLEDSNNDRMMSEDETVALADGAGTHVPRDWMSSTYATVESRFGWTSWTVSTGSIATDVFVDVKRTSAGWPALGFTSYSVLDSRKPKNEQFQSRGEIGLPQWVRPKRDSSSMLVNLAATPFDSVPSIVLWPGFAINTIFYAAILWLPFAVFGRIRRRRRIKRGLCPKCGYDLRGRGGNQNLCPECGASASNPPS